MTDWLDYYLALNEPVIKLSSSTLRFFDVLILPPMYIKGILVPSVTIGLN